MIKFIRTCTTTRQRPSVADERTDRETTYGGNIVRVAPTCKLCCIRAGVTDFGMEVIRLW